MQINRNEWIGPFPCLPRWVCSQCSTGRLSPGSINAFKGEETRASRVYQSDSDIGPDWVEHRFATIIKCDNEGCGEVHSVTGRRENYEDCVPDNEGNFQRERLHVDGVIPAPMPIVIPKGVPDQIANPLKAAANLYWMDSAAAGNALRQAVERFLDFKGVKASEPRKNPKPGQGPEPLSLERRFSDYRDRLGGDTTFLSPVRHVGNVGSHDGALEREHVLIAFEMLERVLEEQFVGSKKRLESAAAVIEQSRGRAKPLK